MKRRNFIKTAVAGLVGAALVPKVVLSTPEKFEGVFSKEFYDKIQYGDVIMLKGYFEQYNNSPIFLCCHDQGEKKFFAYPHPSLNKIYDRHTLPEGDYEFLDMSRVFFTKARQRGWTHSNLVYQNPVHYYNHNINQIT